MARQTLIALVLASVLVAGMAADASRSLQQAKYDCDGAKQINSVPNACGLLCKCAGALNKAYAAASMQNFCLKTCNQCAAAAKKCKGKGQPLPQECAAGSNFKEVNTCINTFLASQKGH
jgi:hypothetical protein